MPEEIFGVPSRARDSHASSRDAPKKEAYGLHRRYLRDDNLL